jgi:hypothetical protein
MGVFIEIYINTPGSPLGLEWRWLMQLMYVVQCDVWCCVYVHDIYHIFGTVLSV